MQFSFSAIAALLAFSASALAQQNVPVTFDYNFDSPDANLVGFACSTGSNGLVTKGYNTTGELPSFPRIGGAYVVGGYNSPNCGTCWQLTYNGVSINVLVIDTAGVGFNINLDAYNELTNGQGSSGKVYVTASQVDGAACGM